MNHKLYGISERSTAGLINVPQASARASPDQLCLFPSNQPCWVGQATGVASGDTDAVGAAVKWAGRARALSQERAAVKWTGWPREGGTDGEDADAEGAGCSCVFCTCIQ